MRYGSQIVPRQNQVNEFYQQPQFQSQIFAQQLTADQAQIRYYIYQNMQFLVNLLYSQEEVLKYFQNNPDHPMVSIGWNKIILQINLSTTINCDLQQTYRNQADVQELERAKDNAKQLFIEATKHLSPELQNYAKEYINNTLSKYVNQKQVPLQPSKLNYNFNQKVVQDVFDNMNYTDQELNMVKRQKNYNIPNTTHVIQTAQQFQQKTNQKLSLNFPQIGTPTKPTKAQYLQQSPPQARTYLNSNLTQSAIYSSPQQNRVPLMQPPIQQDQSQNIQAYLQRVNQFNKQKQQNQYHY